MSNIYRDVTLNQVSENDIGKTLRVAGWVENIRDHGGVSFIDLRDMYAVMQIVIRDGKLLEGIRKEQAVSIEGLIEKRDEETYNPKIPTGTIELEAKSVDILGEVYTQLPFEVMTSPRGCPVEIPLFGFEKPESKRQYYFPFQGNFFLKRENDRDGILRDSDSDSLCIFSGGRKRLHRAIQKIQRKILCIATGTTAVQTASDGIRI